MVLTKRARSLFKVETPQHGVVQLVPADFEVHFWAIDGPSAKIIEPDDHFFAPVGIQDKTRRHHDGGLTGDFLPLGLDLRRVEKDHPQGRQFILFA
jgi:hypothetical protein